MSPSNIKYFGTYGNYIRNFHEYNLKVDTNKLLPAMTWKLPSDALLNHF